MDAAIQYILYFAVLVVLAVPLGRFMAHIMDGEHTFLSPVIAPVERGVYRLLRIDAAEQMGCRRYLASVLVFSGIGLVVLVALQALQSFLPGNPQHLPGVPWDLSFNTAASFITNTNWQSYSGETTLSYRCAVHGSHRAELRFRWHRYRGHVRADSRLPSGQGAELGFLLGRPHPAPSCMCSSR
mgnify:CR=1 FL=1